MVNLQTLLRLVALFSGPFVGWIVGRDLGGWPVGVLGALLGPIIGVLVVETPYWIVKRLAERRLLKASTENLREALQKDPHEYGHLQTLRELRRRGENIDFEKARLVRYLASPSVIERVIGCAGLRECFPEIGARLQDYRPYRPDSANDPIVADLLREIS